MKKLLCIIFIMMLSGAVFAQTDAAAHFNRGVGQFNNGEVHPSITSFSEAIRLNPNYAEAYARRAWAYNRSNNADQAIADANQAIALNPNLALAYFARGTAYVNKFDYTRAIADLTESIRLDPNNALAYNNRAVAYSTISDFDRAIADYTEVIRINPNDFMAYFNRGITYQKKNDHLTAITDYEAALYVNPNHPQAANLRETVNQIKAAIAQNERAQQQQAEAFDRWLQNYFVTQSQPRQQQTQPRQQTQPAQQPQQQQQQRRQPQEHNPTHSGSGLNEPVWTFEIEVYGSYGGVTETRSYTLHRMTQNQALAEARRRFAMDLSGVRDIGSRIISTRRSN